MKNKFSHLASVLLILQIGVFNSCQSQHTSLTTEEQANLLNHYAQGITDNNGEKKKEYQLSFFQSFPSDFNTFYKIYGYHENTKYHKVNFNHSLFTLLPQLKEITPKREYYVKMINVGINGTWEADEVGILQHHLQEIVPESINLSVDILSSKGEDKIKSFWYFLYDGPHPDNYKESYESLHAKVKQVNPKVKRN